MARGKASDNESATITKEPKEEAQETPNRQAPVKFAWNRPIRERVITLRAAKTRFVDGGTILDPDNPGKRIKVKDGFYATSDPEEIEELKKNPDFGKPNEDGFSIVRELTPEEDLKALMKRHNITKEKLMKVAEEG